MKQCISYLVIFLISKKKEISYESGSSHSIRHRADVKLLCTLSFRCAHMYLCMFFRCSCTPVICIEWLHSVGSDFISISEVVQMRVFIFHVRAGVRITIGTCVIHH